MDEQRTLNLNLVVPPPANAVKYSDALIRITFADGVFLLAGAPRLSARERRHLRLKMQGVASGYGLLYDAHRQGLLQPGTEEAAGGGTLSVYTITPRPRTLEMLYAIGHVVTGTPAAFVTGETSAAPCYWQRAPQALLGNDTIPEHPTHRIVDEHGLAISRPTPGAFVQENAPSEPSSPRMEVRNPANFHRRNNSLLPPATTQENRAFTDELLARMRPITAQPRDTRSAPVFWEPKNVRVEYSLDESNQTFCFKFTGFPNDSQHRQLLAFMQTIPLQEAHTVRGKLVYGLPFQLNKLRPPHEYGQRLPETTPAFTEIAVAFHEVFGVQLPPPNNIEIFYPKPGQRVRTVVFPDAVLSAENTVPSVRVSSPVVRVLGTVLWVAVESPADTDFVTDMIRAGAQWSPWYHLWKVNVAKEPEVRKACFRTFSEYDKSRGWVSVRDDAGRELCAVQMLADVAVRALEEKACPAKNRVLDSYVNVRSDLAYAESMCALSWFSRFYDRALKYQKDADDLETLLFDLAEKIPEEKRDEQIDYAVLHFNRGGCPACHRG